MASQRSIDLRCYIILGFTFAGILALIVQYLPDALEALARVL